MKPSLLSCLVILLASPVLAQPAKYENVWESAPQHIPNESSVDAPLMGNGDIGMSMGFEKGLLRYYLTKNDFWRLQSKADHLSGPRVAGFIDLKIAGFEDARFSAHQSLMNGKTDCILSQNGHRLSADAWVAATGNLVFITLEAIDGPVKVRLDLNAPENKMANLSVSETKGVKWLTRAFETEVDIPTKIAFALKMIGAKTSDITLTRGKPIYIAIAFESKFKKDDPLTYVVKKAGGITQPAMVILWKQHNDWWNAYWKRSSLTVSDTVLMKAYYQGLYTMGACARDKKFPPAIFGWCTTDKPTWNGDYHLNYNFYAPFYALYGANRLEQAATQDAPLIDFMPQGKWYAQRVTKTRGILYPVGIGPLGIDLTRNFPIETDGGYTLERDVESGGLFYMQRSNSVFGTINMAQYWRCTYDLAYAKRIYPYVLAVADFWEDYLKLENDRYIIYDDAENEKSGFSENPTMSLALIRNALELMIDLSTALKRDLQRQGKWNDILDKLSDYATGSEGNTMGFLGAKPIKKRQTGGASFSLIYPANAVTLNSSDSLLTIARNTIANSQRWMHENSTNSFYMAAIRVGYNRDKILNELHKYALHTYPNGFQLDNPHGIENACTVANALQEMFCMSVGNRIRLFKSWPKGIDASFENVRCWGAFLVSARLSNGIINELNIKSEKGRDCAVVNPWPAQQVLIIRNGKAGEKLTGNIIDFKTSVNELIELRLAP